MNRFETWFCGSLFWRYVTRRQLLPWIRQGSELGEDVLELGAGPGAATEELGRLAARVTSLEYDHAFAAKLGARVNGSDATVIPRGTYQEHLCAGGASFRVCEIHGYGV